jgi:hypothetical protein
MPLNRPWNPPQQGQSLELGSGNMQEAPPGFRIERTPFGSRYVPIQASPNYPGSERGALGNWGSTVMGQQEMLPPQPMPSGPPQMAPPQPMGPTGPPQMVPPPRPQPMPAGPPQPVGPPPGFRQRGPGMGAPVTPVGPGVPVTGVKAPVPGYGGPTGPPQSAGPPPGFRQRGPGMGPPVTPSGPGVSGTGWGGPVAPPSPGGPPPWAMPATPVGPSPLGPGVPGSTPYSILPSGADVWGGPVGPPPGGPADSIVPGPIDDPNVVPAGFRMQRTPGFGNKLVPTQAGSNYPGGGFTGTDQPSFRNLPNGTARGWKEHRPPKNWMW